MLNSEEKIVFKHYVREFFRNSNGDVNSYYLLKNFAGIIDDILQDCEDSDDCMVDCDGSVTEIRWFLVNLANKLMGDE